MMTRTNLITLFILSVLLTGCKQQPVDQTVTEISVDTENLSENADDFFDSYSYVVLDTDSTAMIGEINKIDMDDENIVISSRNDVFVFDRKGHIVSNFNNFGQGPDEYLDIFDLKLKDGIIYILSRSAKEIKTYSLYGKIIDSYSLPDYFSAMALADGTVWLASETANECYYEFVEYSLDKHEVVKRVMPFERNQSFLNSAFNPFLMQHDGKLYVSRLFDMNVSTIDCKSGNVAQKWRFKFNTEKQLDDFDREQGFAYMYSATANKPVITHLGHMAETDKSYYMSLDIFFRISYFTNLYKFDKEHPEDSGQLLRIGLMTYDRFPFLKSRPLMIYDNCYVSTLDADRVISIAESLNINELNATHLSEDSNPVLFFHQFK